MNCKAIHKHHYPKKLVASQIGIVLCVISLAVSQQAMSDKLPVLLNHIYPSNVHSSIKFDAPILASPLLDLTPSKPQLIIPVTDGIVSFLDAETGSNNGQVTLPASPGLRILIMSTPVQIDRNLIVLYQTLGKKGRESHRLAVIDLATRQLNSAFSILELNAELPQADGKSVVKFNPAHAFSHSTVVYAHKAESKSGFLYAAFGNAADIQPFHGWLFEIDLDAWKQNGTKAAVKSVLVTTPESQCKVSAKYGTREMICAGGIWTPAGPQVLYQKDDYSLLVPTGNGQVNLARHDYANSLMRVKPGLQFDPQCNREFCKSFNPAKPSLACIESCKNLFIPRLKAGDKPLRPGTGDCDQRTFWECLAWMDYDLGANAPVIVNISAQQSVIVQAGKDGAAYLLDANHLGTMYDRIQLVDTCGTKLDPCKLDWRGMMVTQPAVSMLGQIPVVIFPTFVSDETHAAGLIAVQILVQDGKPYFKPFWQFPDPESPNATKTFRSPPGLPVMTHLSKHGDVIWIVDIGKTGTLYGVRIDDGKLIARTSLVGTGVPLSRPIAFGNRLYMTSSQSGKKQSWVESIQYQ